MGISVSGFQAVLPQRSGALNSGKAPLVTFGNRDLLTRTIQPSGKTLPILNANAAPGVLREAVTGALQNFRFPHIQDALIEDGWRVVFAESPAQYPGKLTRQNAMEKAIAVPVVAQYGEWLVPESLTCMYEGLAEAVDTSMGKRQLSLWNILNKDEPYVRHPLSASKGFRQAVEKDCDNLTMVEKVIHRNDRLHDILRQELADLFEYGLPASDSAEGQDLIALAAKLNGERTLPSTRFSNTRAWLTQALREDWFLISRVADPF